MEDILYAWINEIKCNYFKRQPTQNYFSILNLQKVIFNAIFILYKSILLYSNKILEHLQKTCTKNRSKLYYFKTSYKTLKYDIRHKKSNIYQHFKTHEWGDRTQEKSEIKNHFRNKD